MDTRATTGPALDWGHARRQASCRPQHTRFTVAKRALTALFRDAFRIWATAVAPSEVP